MSARRSALSVLLLCDDWKGHANTIHDHIRAFKTLSRHEVWTYNPRGLRRVRALDLDAFDVVVIHYSLCVLFSHYLPDDLREKLRRYRGLKVQFVQDDYRWVDAITAVMRDIGTHVLFTLVPAPEIPKIWDDRLPGVVKCTTLAGYVPDELVHRRVPGLEARPLDIGYRGRVLPPWLGRIGQEKAWIAQGVLARAGAYGLKVDVGWRESDRIYGRSWVDFISSCKATLGTESGATITDFDGSIERAVKAYEADHPQADFEEVHREVLAAHEGNVRMNVISPRVFEAVALRTGLILFPGEYSGVVRPGEHYLPLAKDFSNMAEVVDGLRDGAGMQRMIARAYDEIALSGRYSLKAFVAEFDEVVAELGHARGPRRKTTYHVARIEAWWRSAALLERTGLPALTHLAFRTAVTAGLALADRDVSTAVALQALDPNLWRAVSPLRVVMDLIRFGLLRYVQRRGLLNESRVRVSASWDPASGSLTFVTRKIDRMDRDEGGRTVESGADLAEAVRVALEEGTVRTISWNHGLIGSTVPYAITRSRWITVGLGDSGIYRFSALAAIARREPSRVGRALTRALEEEPAEASSRFRRALARRVWLVQRALWRVWRGCASSDSPAAVAADVLRLHVLWEIQAGQSGSAEPFRVTASYDEGARRLRLVSVPTDPWGRDANGNGVGAFSRESTPAIRAALAAGELRSFEWDHSGVGRFVLWEMKPSRYYLVRLGRDGVYRFEHVLRGFRAAPVAAWRTLLPILEVKNRPSAGLRLLRAPGVYGPLVVVALHGVLTRASLRQALVRFLVDPVLRVQIPVARVLQELTNLRLLQDAAATAPGGYGLRIEKQGEGELVFRTVPGTGKSGRYQDALSEGVARRYVWDHSAVGDSVEYRGLGLRCRLSLGPERRYEFHTLAALAARAPETIRRLLPALE